MTCTGVLFGEAGQEELQRTKMQGKAKGQKHAATLSKTARLCTTYPLPSHQMFTLFSPENSRQSRQAFQGPQIWKVVDYHLRGDFFLVQN